MVLALPLEALMRPSATREDLHRSVREKIAQLPHARELTAFLATEPGKALRRELEAVVMGDAAGDTVETTYFNLGMQAMARRLLHLDTNEKGAGE
jgi:hypothetical protein